MTKPRVLIFSDYYLPGVKAGGPIRSLAGLVDALKNDVNFSVVTRDRDWGDGEPYPSLPTKLDEVNVHYLSPAELTFSNMKRIVDEVSPQIIYLNSFFSWHFSIKLLCLQYIGRLKNIKILLAPRGEFSRGALRLKSIKKNIYLKLAKLLGMYKKITWHATSKSEEIDIKSVFPNARIMLAGNLPSIQLTNDKKSHKREGALRLVFLSRISRKKNL
ncbi:MAG: glycosyl transferase family 1, partial [Legionellaceae bacterium]|nr:glycosyl transferase family 1 [Legionellaceae bacterium]